MRVSGVPLLRAGLLTGPSRKATLSLIASGNEEGKEG